MLKEAKDNRIKSKIVILNKKTKLCNIIYKNEVIMYHEINGNRTEFWNVEKIYIY